MRKKELQIKHFLLLVILTIPLFCFSQGNIVINNINNPGEKTNGRVVGFVLGQAFLGPKKVRFITDQSLLKRNEINSSGSSSSKFDILDTEFSGKIYSPDIIGPFVFENKTLEEISNLDITVFPKIMEKPYTLYLDLTISASSKPIDSPISDDAGVYHGILTLSIKNINE